MSFTIGSLFDGSGGFPLAATMCGGIPKWASEVEPYPIAVTKSRFPNVKHLGSVTDIKGGEVEPVDVITFGSPCQDLSVAGKRAGLKHEANGDEETTRSGLFMEAVRIIKEMREATNGVYPRFALWENVPGAFSSNKGEDFRVVLQELIQVAEPTAVMPEVPKNGWPYADSYCGDGWSLAYRVLDAQFWGVPQRRRRIYLVADFRGECAGKVSFEREGLRGYFETGGTPWQTVAGDAEAGSGAADSEGKPHSVSYTLKIRSGCEGGGKGALIQEDMSATLATNNDQYLFQPICMATQQGGAEIMVDKCPTITASAGMSGNNQPVVCYKDQVFTLEPGIAAREGGHIYEGVSGTLRANAGDNQMAVAHMVLDDQGGSQISVRDDGKCPTLRAEMHGNIPSVMEPIPIHDQATRFSGKRGDKSDGKGNGLGVGNADCPMFTLTAGDRHAVSYWDGGQTMATLTANNAGGNQRMPDKENFNCVIETHVVSNDEGPVVIDRAFFNQGQNAKYDPQYYTDGTVPTLVARGPAGVAYSLDEKMGQTYAYEEQVHTLSARDYKQPKTIAHIRPDSQIRYIVRRLTPTECARLQGFPDTWGHPDVKTELTDAEYQFWLNVRNTHAVINDKATKEYTKEQILKWYNGLHTDSSEYKMWGNGIALPNALYMMQGIADVMSEEKAARRKWLKDLLGDCL